MSAAPVVVKPDPAGCHRTNPAPPSPVARLDQHTRELLVGALIAVGVVAVCVLWWRDTSVASVHGVGPWLSAAGRVSGLVGSYLVVIEVLLMGRLAWLDRLIGMDRLAHWHRRNGEYCVSLLVGHAVLIVWGYAVTEHTNVVSEAKSVVFSYTDVMAATVGLGLLVGVGVISARGIRRRVSYHTWYFIHLYTYLAVALSFAHQFATEPILPRTRSIGPCGSRFTSSPGPCSSPTGWASRSATHCATGSGWLAWSARVQASRRSM